MQASEGGSTDEQIEAFRSEGTAWRGPRRQGARPYPTVMKTRALSLARYLGGRGVRLDAIARRLGIATATLAGWQGTTRPAGLVPVRVVAESADEPLTAPVRLRSPRGYLVETSGVATAVALLRERG